MRLKNNWLTIACLVLLLISLSGLFLYRMGITDSQRPFSRNNQEPFDHTGNIRHVNSNDIEKVVIFFHVFVQQQLYVNVE